MRTDSVMIIPAGPASARQATTGQLQTVSRESRREQQAAASAPELAACPRRIRRPLRAKLAWFLRVELPVLSFCIAAACTAVLWYRQAARITLPGEVHSTGNSIVVYISRESHVSPEAGMPVRVSTTSGPRLVFDSQVQTVGARVQRVPERLLTHRNVPEWGRVVRIAIPPEAGLAPGQPVNVAFRLVNEAAARSTVHSPSPLAGLAGSQRPG